MDDEWLTSTEAAELASAAKPDLMGAANRGEVPCYRIGRYYRFRIDEVEAWLLANRLGQSWSRMLRSWTRR